MRLITKPYETSIGFTSMTDDELFLINGGCMSGAIEIMQNFVNAVVDGVMAFREFFGVVGDSFTENGPGNTRDPDVSSKNPNRPINPAC